MTERPMQEDRFVARMLLDEYGVARERAHIARILPLVQAVRRTGLIHALIVASVRGFVPNPLTNNLTRCLEELRNENP